MLAPAYAIVTSMTLEKSFYTDEENIKFIGTQNGTEVIFVIIRNSNGNFEGMLSDPTPQEGEFSVIPRQVTNFFKSEGIYNATGFVDSQQEKDGFVIKLEYDGDKVFIVPDAILQLNSIPDKTVDVEKTITFTASITDSSIDNPVFSLKNAPTGATINPDTGKFVWTPSKSQGNIQDVHYNFDVIVTHGSQEDKESITITVKQAYVEPVKEPKTEPKETTPEPPAEPKELGIASFVDETKDPQYYVDRYNNEATYKEWFDDNFAEYDSIYQAVGLEAPVALASFVDETKDPQYYVDRYNNEATYKEWFDENFAEYDSIYQAVGLEAPKELAPFVDPNLDPQYYVDRYNNEATYKEWFDKTYPDITIYEAVGLEDEEIAEEEFGECGLELN